MTSTRANCCAGVFPSIPPNGEALVAEPETASSGAFTPTDEPNSVRDWEEPAGEDADEKTMDLAMAQQAVEEYEAKGIEGTIPYSQYRSKWLGPES